MFIKWSMGLTFTFEEAHLRLVSSFEEILPRPSGEDINAIASHFLKTRNTKQQFNAGKGIELHLIIPHTKFLAAEQRRNGEEVAESKSRDVRFQHGLLVPCMTDRIHKPGYTSRNSGKFI